MKTLKLKITVTNPNIVIPTRLIPICKRLQITHISYVLIRWEIAFRSIEKLRHEN